MRSQTGSCILLAATPVAIGFAALLMGRLWLPPGEVLGALLSRGDVPDLTRTLVLGVRLPRVLAAGCVGAGLSAAGAAFQGMFRNPLVEPRILGASSGAALGAAAAMLAGWSTLAVQASAFALGLVAVAGAWVLSRGFGASVLVLVIAGIVVASAFDALLGILKYVADPTDALPAITYWLLGGLGTVRWAHLWPLLGATGAGTLLLIASRWRLNVLSLDELEAESLGLPVRRWRLAVVAAGTLLTAAAVAAAGVIGWIGLLVPHAARALVGPDHGRLLPASLAIGAALLILLDTVARTALPAEIPLGILTGLVGIPAFVFLFLRTIHTRGGWR
ncbi:MAG: iron ABC transporter permease [Candidatus Bipolaricaulota bacterium]